MLNRVREHEYSAQQPAPIAAAAAALYHTKRNSLVVVNKDTGIPQVVIHKTIHNGNGGGGGGQGCVNGLSNGHHYYDLNSVQTLNNTSSVTKRKILEILQEVNTKRTIRECRESDEDLGSVLGMHTYFNQKTTNYKQKYRVYNFLNYPKGFWAISYHILVFIMVFACLIVTVFSTIHEFHNAAMKFLYLLEKVIIIWFSGEFLLRWWSASCKNQYQGWKGKIKYLSVPSRLMDIIVIALSLGVLTFNPSSGHEVFAASAFRGFHRFFQVLQILTLNKQLQPWKVLSSVIYDQREQLFIIFYIEFIVLCILAYISYIVEKDDNPQFDSIAEAMWWALITLSTIGYGDRVPITWLGKLISSLFTVLGVAIFALPAGIIGTGLALKVEEEERNQQRKKKKVAAAVLIQSMWRCYKANANYQAVSTFFKHKPMDLFKQHDYENVANKFIRLTRFFIARQRFKELLRPVDIKNVLQSYKDGQLDVMAKVKQIQRSVDRIVQKIAGNEQQIYGQNSRMDDKLNRLESTLAGIRQLLDKQFEAIDLIVGRIADSQQFVDYIVGTGSRTQSCSCQCHINNTNTNHSHSDNNSRPDRTGSTTSSSSSSNNNNNTNYSLNSCDRRTSL
ncbi:potassium voltage-gated channel subfamily KQT member 2-like [Oppia nitens]|uniref:potassium voltage-gated channel subfamily KQT member 2-like n=1 Tax=Oppia nitens TaxID=1686743 RepID=UPI0023DB1E4F|nr:potassium voltage-gated channel subfamily KQT member 2-like [Oppia nitens]